MPATPKSGSLELIFRSPGQGQWQLTLASCEISLTVSSSLDNWYRVTLNVLVDPVLNTYTATGTIQSHVHWAESDTAV